MCLGCTVRTGACQSGGVFVCERPTSKRCHIRGIVTSVHAKSVLALPLAIAAHSDPTHRQVRERDQPFWYGTQGPVIRQGGHLIKPQGPPRDNIGWIGRGRFHPQSRAGWVLNSCTPARVQLLAHIHAQHTGACRAASASILARAEQAKIRRTAHNAMVVVRACRDMDTRECTGQLVTSNQLYN